ncbi:MAG: amidase [Bacteroidetes bacterium]|nr:amidase [Bacteroidota bacterium]
MKRRDFVKYAAMGSGAIALNPLAACAPDARKKEPASTPSNISTDADLDEETIESLKNMMETGEITSEEIVQKYLDRINEIDYSGPELRSVIEINPDALEIAREMDKEREKGSFRGPLHGIPVIIKDNIDTGDKMHTTAGSLALEEFKAEMDAFIVSQLRKSGAVLIGKSNLSEWANIRSTRSSSGWSGRGGQVRNPYVLDRTPCGSTSGTAVAVSANLCTIGIGTETDGSIVCPAAINGIVGIKPTLGLWSRHGIIPISHSQDTAGPMARTVKDAAILLGALTGIDKYDDASVTSDGNLHKDYTRFLEKDGLKGSRIGIIRDFHGFDPNVDKLLNEQYEFMKRIGAELIEVECADDRQKWGDAEWTVLLYELKHDLNKYLKDHPNAKVRNLNDIIVFNKSFADIEMPWFGQEIFIDASVKGALNEEEYQTALKTSKELSQNAIDQVMDEHKLDALIAPTNAPAWTIDWLNGDHFIGGSSDLAAVSGYPSITVPAGFIHELPIGMSFIGKAWSEPTLLKLAYAYEQLTLHRKKPDFLKSIR